MYIEKKETDFFVSYVRCLPPFLSHLLGWGPERDTLADARPGANILNERREVASGRNSALHTAESDFDAEFEILPVCVPCIVLFVLNLCSFITHGAESVSLFIVHCV